MSDDTEMSVIRQRISGALFAAFTVGFVAYFAAAPLFQAPPDAALLASLLVAGAAALLGWWFRLGRLIEWVIWIPWS